MSEVVIDMIVSLDEMKQYLGASTARAEVPNVILE